MGQQNIIIFDKQKNEPLTFSGIAEQDIPFITDKIDQWIRTFWGDLFINNVRRHTDKTEVLPIVA